MTGMHPRCITVLDRELHDACMTASPRELWYFEVKAATRGAVHEHASK